MKPLSILGVVLSISWPIVYGHKDSISITTTSGHLQGNMEDDVLSFKGVRFGIAPTGPLRWRPPVAFQSTSVQNATRLGPSCVQQFPIAIAELAEFLYNNPPPPEDEDCLFLNIWVPSSFAPAKLKPVIVWIYGGGFDFGTGSLRMYDGASLAKNQDIIVVNFNYRTNVFGFPAAPDLPVIENNLGLLDQELAFKWIRENIIQFGGDPNRVTIMGQSAGSWSVAAAIIRNQKGFNAGIMLSGSPLNPADKLLDFTPFNNFAKAMNCTQSAGPTRLDCLRKVPAPAIRNWTNGPSGGHFDVMIDNLTFYGDELGRILTHKTSRTPLMIGSNLNDSSVFVLGITNLTELIQEDLPGINATADYIRSLYPGRNDTQVIQEFWRDLTFRCPDNLWTGAMLKSGVKNVFRYTYGAAFPDTQFFPNAGAWHASELEVIFGTFNRTTSSEKKAVLSKSLQTTIGNFARDPTRSPAPNWNRYDPTRKTLAELAFDGNVDFDDFVHPVTSDTEDGACTAFFNAILGPGV